MEIVHVLISMKLTVTEKISNGTRLFNECSKNGSFYFNSEKEVTNKLQLVYLIGYFENACEIY